MTLAIVRSRQFSNPAQNALQHLKLLCKQRSRDRIFVTWTHEDNNLRYILNELCYFRDDTHHPNGQEPPLQPRRKRTEDDPVRE
ncbi:hypothetical protein B0H19DRAFT_1115967 [Mycena capillaripes]|nr:hypothetical protein B0H19DRAFT_1115967 [Mycena capillaripes]